MPNEATATASASVLRRRMRVTGPSPSPGRRRALSEGIPADREVADPEPLLETVLETLFRVGDTIFDHRGQVVLHPVIPVGSVVGVEDRGKVIGLVFSPVAVGVYKVVAQVMCFRWGSDQRV